MPSSVAWGSPRGTRGGPTGTEGTGRGDAAPWERSDLFADNISINCWHLTVLVLIFPWGCLGQILYGVCYLYDYRFMYVYIRYEHICASKVHMRVWLTVTHHFQYNWIYTYKDYFSNEVTYPSERHICRRSVLKQSDLPSSSSDTLGKESIKKRKKK